MMFYHLYTIISDIEKIFCSVWMEWSLQVLHTY